MWLMVLFELNRLACMLASATRFVKSSNTSELIFNGDSSQLNNLTELSLLSSNFEMGAPELGLAEPD